MAYPRRPIAKTCGTVSVTTSSQELIANNPSRLELIITNDSDTDVSLALRTTTGVEATATDPAGIVLKANGGSWATTSYTGPVAFIHGGTGTKSVAVVEI